MKLDYGQRGEEVREGSQDIFSDTKRKATWDPAALTTFHSVMENSSLIHNLCFIAGSWQRVRIWLILDWEEKREQKENKSLKCIHPSLKSLSWVHLQETPEDKGCQLIQKHNQTTKEKNKRSHSLVQRLKFGLKITGCGQGKKLRQIGHIPKNANKCFIPERW